jgi:acyl carrier protein
MNDETDVLGELQTVYRELKASSRSVSREDRLIEDLAIDSLLGQELLFRLEDRLNIEILGNPQLMTARTVGDILDMIGLAQATR